MMELLDETRRPNQSHPCTLQDNVNRLGHAMKNLPCHPLLVALRLAMIVLPLLKMKPPQNSLPQDCTVYSRWKSNPFGELLVRWVELSYQAFMYVRTSPFQFCNIVQRQRCCCSSLNAKVSRSRNDTRQNQPTETWHVVIRHHIGSKTVAVAWTFRTRT